MLADDEGIMLESLKKIIETDMEMNVKSTVQSQAELWWRWHRHPPDICFMDIQMPNKRNPGNQEIQNLTAQQFL